MKLLNLTLLSLILITTACQNRKDETITRLKSGKGGRNTATKPGTPSDNNATPDESFGADTKEVSLTAQELKDLDTVKGFDRVKRIKSEAFELNKIYGQVLKAYRTKQKEKVEDVKVDTSPLAIISKAVQSLLESKNVIIEVDKKNYIIAESKNNQKVPVFKFVVPIDEKGSISLYYGVLKTNAESQKLASWKVENSKVTFSFFQNSPLLIKLIEYKAQYSMLPEAQCEITMQDINDIESSRIEKAVCKNIGFVKSPDIYTIADVFEYNLDQGKGITVTGSVYQNNSKVKDSKIKIDSFDIVISETELFAPEETPEQKTKAAADAQAKADAEAKAKKEKEEADKKKAIELAVNEAVQRGTLASDYTGEEYEIWLKSQKKPAPEGAQNDGTQGDQHDDTGKPSTPPADGAIPVEVEKVEK